MSVDVRACTSLRIRQEQNELDRLLADVDGGEEEINGLGKMGENVESSASADRAGGDQLMPNQPGRHQRGKVGTRMVCASFPRRRLPLDRAHGSSLRVQSHRTRRVELQEPQRFRRRRRHIQAR